jgi:hypothetical protein
MIFHSPYQNIEIYKYLILKMDGIPIKRTDHFNLLGLTLNETVSWVNHTNKIAGKVGSAIGVIYRLRHTLPKRALMTIYNSLILSHLHYCNILWGHTPGKLFLLQQKALRAVTFSDIATHCNQICKKISTLLLMDIHKQKMLNVYKLLNSNLIPVRIKSILSNISNGRYSNINTDDFTEHQMKNFKFELPYSLNRDYYPEALAYIDGPETRNINYNTTKQKIKDIIIDSYPARCPLLECATCKIIMEDISLPTKASKANRRRKNKKKKKTCPATCRCIDCQALRIKTQMTVFTEPITLLIPPREYEQSCPLECYCPLCADRTIARLAYERRIVPTPSTRVLIPRPYERPCPTECYCENCADTTYSRLTRQRQLHARREELTARNIWLYS